MNQQVLNENKQQWYIYIIENRLSQLYTGITTNVERRFQEHQKSGSKAAKALKGKGPLILRFSQKVGNKTQALQLEHRLKKLSRQQKLNLISKGEIKYH